MNRSVVLVVSVALTLSMVVVRTLRQPGFFAEPGARLQFAEPVVLLVVYLTGILWMTRSRYARENDAALRSAMRWGLLGAALQSVHLLVERFVTLRGGGGTVTLPFMLATFSLWAVPAWQAARSGERTSVALLCAVWAAVVTMSLTVFAGTLLELYIAPIPPQTMRQWPEFVRSGWTNLPAFAVGNTLDAITSHLLLAPPIAVLAGLSATALGRRRRALPA